MFCPNCGTKNNDDARFCENCGTSLSEYHNTAGNETVHQSNDTAVPQMPEMPANDEYRQYNNETPGNRTPQPDGMPSDDRQMRYNAQMPSGGSDRHKTDKTPFIIIGAAVAVIVIAAGIFLATDNPIKAMLSGADHEYEASETESDEDERETEEAFFNEDYDREDHHDDDQTDGYSTDEAVGGDRFLGRRGIVDISRLGDDRYHVYIKRTAGDAVYEYYLQGTYEPGGVYYDGEDLDCIDIDKGICYYTVDSEHDPYAYYIYGDDDFYLYFGPDDRLYVYDFTLREEYPADEAGNNVTDPDERYYLDESDYDPYADELSGDNIIFTDTAGLSALGLNNLQNIVPDNVGETSYIVQEGNYDNTGRSAFDGDISTSWQVEKNNGIGETVYCTYNEMKNVDVIRLNTGNWRSDELYGKNDRPATILIRLWNQTNNKMTDICVSFPDWKEEYAIVLPHTYSADEIDFEILNYYPGSMYTDNCISEISVYSK